MKFQPAQWRGGGCLPQCRRRRVRRAAGRVLRALRDFLPIAYTLAMPDRVAKLLPTRPGRVTRRSENRTHDQSTRLRSSSSPRFSPDATTGPRRPAPFRPESASQPSTSTGDRTRPRANPRRPTRDRRPTLCKDKTWRSSRIGRHRRAPPARSCTVWRVTNTSSEPCRSFGYPGMDFHAASGWLDVQVHRGRVPT